MVKTEVFLRKEHQQKDAKKNKDTEISRTGLSTSVRDLAHGISKNGKVVRVGHRKVAFKGVTSNRILPVLGQLEQCEVSNHRLNSNISSFSTEQMTNK